MNRKTLSLVILALILLFAMPVFAEGEEAAPNFGWLSILPPLVAIVLAFATKQVLLSLFLGIFLGATMLNGWNPGLGFLRSFDEYMVGSLADTWDAAIMIFLLSIGGMVGVINKMGGTIAVADALSKKVKSSKTAQLFTWILGVLVFFDDYANTLIVGPTMRPITDKNNVSKEKLSFLIDSTSAPVTGIALISTWVGYQVGVIRNVYQSMGMEGNYYGIFLQSIPYSYYCIFALVLSLFTILMQREYGPMYDAEKRARTTGKLIADGAKPMSSDEITKMEIRKDIKYKASNAVVPIVTLIVSAFIGLWYNGYLLTEEAINPFSMEGLRICFGNADSSMVLLWASMISSILAMVMGVAQKILTMDEAFDSWVDGAKSMVMACMILLLAWSLGTVTKSVGTADFLVQVVSNKLPFAILPVIVFAISAVISFATGTAWGTMAIVIPLAIPLAFSFVEVGGDPHMVIVTISAVLSGAIFGDHCSPISDTTIMSSMASGSDHLDHVKTQMPYALTAAVIGAICYLIAGFLGAHPVVVLLIGTAMIYGVLKFYGKSVKVEDLKKETAK